ncbi:MAG: flagellar basal body P-ring formation chaperone FlgA [Gallionellaceae bacterium]|nr:flagellar basal body P-ring formation chaperone FlgA [Gallionellaceae bacterium]
MRCLPVWLVLLLLFQTSAWAETRQDFPVLRAAAGRFVSGQVGIAYPESHADVTIGPIDPRLNLASCPEPVFTLAPGSNLWGSGTLAVDCTSPKTWGLYLSYRTVLRGPALLAKRPLPAGTVPGPADVIKDQVEYAGDPGRYPRDPASLRGAALSRPLAKNSPISIDMLRIRPIIRAGQRVRILIDGNGFQVSQDGIAQSQAGAGDSLRLKTPSGRYVQGTVQPDGTVRVRP